MAQKTAFHSTSGGAHFLGLRRNRRGAHEIVYDDGVARRMVWRVLASEISEARLTDALRVAVNHTRVIPALYAELRKRSIGVEMVAG